MPSVEEQLAEALTVNEALRAENEVLRDRVAHLEKLLSTDSSTSSKPPSTDPMGTRQKRAERRAGARATKRAQGKQPGAPGANLERRRANHSVDHDPPACRCCGADLSAAPVVGTVIRQVIDLPRIEPSVTDHVAYRRRCACGAETVGDLPPEARAPVCWGPEVRAFALYLLDRQHLPVARTAELLADVLGAPVSTGWLCNLQAEAAGRLAPFLAEITTRLAAEPVIHADETSTRVGTAKAWVHTVTTGVLTLLVTHPKRGVEAMADIGIFDGYRGTIVHDGLAAYDTYTDASHAQCGAHLLRHLDDVGETIAFTLWTRQLAGILLAARDASLDAAAAGFARVPTDIATKIWATTTPPSTSRSPSCPTASHRGGATAADGTTHNARHGTSPPACAPGSTRCSASSTTPGCHSPTTRRREHCAW